MKRDYKAPDIEQLNIEVERGFEASDPWYNQGGQGDFTYGTETEDRWE